MDMPQVGDVWRINRIRRKVTNVTQSLVYYEYDTTPGQMFSLHPKWFTQESTLVERDGKAVGK